MSNSYLIVFHGDIQKLFDERKICDVSNDPNFEELPSWGICRPPTRKYIDIGDNLFFLAYYKPLKRYYVKGWFEVGNKISYKEALLQFPNRKNVMISDRERNIINSNWRYKDLKKEITSNFGQDYIPDWLKRINVQEGVFYQNNLDNHEIDNWKCRRIFHCRKTNFMDCIQQDSCIKDGISLNNYKNYIVAHKSNWLDVGNKLINYKLFKKNTSFNKEIRTPKGQHNVIKCDDFKDKFIDYLKNI